jgi:hypothetical protein
MKPLIIIPDANQKTITMTIEDFKKTIGEVWEEGYKEGQTMKQINSFPLVSATPYIDTIKQGPSSVCNEATVANEVTNKRLFNEINTINNCAEELKLKNIW